MSINTTAIKKLQDTKVYHIHGFKKQKRVQTQNENVIVV